MRPFPPPALALVPFAAVLLLAAPKGSAQAPEPIRLAWPLACRIGVDCEIQHYTDHDPSGVVKDYTCGGRSYDTHDGTDIRLPDMAAQRRGVLVLAAADGRVQAVRDGVDDAFVHIVGAEAVKGKQCGNRVAIMHPGGFQTDYCHMAKGSLLVKPGEVVKAGTPLGRVGLSGDTDFPHLHFAVRQNNQVVDPFAYGAAPGACSGGRSLWAQTPAYRTRVVVNAGFTDAAPTLEAVENGVVPAPAAEPAQLLAYVRAIGLKAGDVREIVLRDPAGAVVGRSRAEPLARDRDIDLIYVGARRPGSGWAKGRYHADYVVTGRDGQAVATRGLDLSL